MTSRARSSAVLPTSASRGPLGATGELLDLPGDGQAVIGFAPPQRFLAIRRHGEHWCSPVVGGDLSAIPADTLCLLLSYGKQVEVVLPLVTDHVQASLVGAAGGVRVTVRSDVAGAAAQLAVARGTKAFAVVRETIAAVAERFGRFKVRSDKPAPAWIDEFGWCTWDSFVPYRSVSAEGVVRGLDAFAKAGMVPPLMILDDGWQDTDPPLSTHGGTLISLGTEPSRFPDGLAPVVKAAKERGVRTFGVWHTLEGYWEGLQPDSPLAKDYGAKSSGNGTPHPVPGTVTPCTAIPPASIARFYHDYHRTLAEAGVDLVKVDNQGSLPRHLGGVAPAVSGMRTYQEALQGSTAMHLDGNLLTCMGMDSIIYYHQRLGTVARNSEDYAPRAAEGHGRHLVSNAYNNVWTSSLVVPDWDMFWSGGPTGAYHAAARALSGGPVYVSDEPGKFDRGVLRQLVVRGGRVLRPERPALPAEAVLFRDPLTEDVPLVIHAINNGVGSIGVFNCRNGGGEQSCAIAPAMVDDLVGDEFIVRMYRDGSVRRSRRGESAKVTLGAHGFEIATVAPIREGVAVLGSLAHFHGAGHVASHTVAAPGQHVVWLLEGGQRIGIWCATAPSAVLVDGKALPASKRTYDKKTGMLELKLGEGRALQVELRFAAGKGKAAKRR